MKNKILKKILVATAMLGSIATYSQGIICNDGGGDLDQEQYLLRITSGSCESAGASEETSSYTLETSAATSFTVSMDLDQYWGKLDPAAQIDKDALGGIGQKPLSALLSSNSADIIVALGGIATVYQRFNTPQYNGQEGDAIYSLVAGEKSQAKRFVDGAEQDILLRTLTVFADSTVDSDGVPDGFFDTNVDISVDAYTGPLASIIFRFDSVQVDDQLNVSVEDFNSLGGAKDSRFEAYAAGDASQEVRFKNMASGVITGPKLEGPVSVRDLFNLGDVLTNSGDGSGSRMVIANASIRYLPQTAEE